MDWAERRYLDPKIRHPTIAMIDHYLIYLKIHLEIYYLIYIYRREKKNMMNNKINPKLLVCYRWLLEPVIFIIPLGMQMDGEKSELQIE